MTGGALPSDAVGAQTLETMSKAGRYNAWQYSRIAPYLGRRICEIGAGIGNLSELLLAEDRDLVLLTDHDPYYLRALRNKFASRANVEIVDLRLPDEGIEARLGGHQIDTAVALNVVEHIEDDLGAVRSIARLLAKGGRFVMLVPAHPSLYGSLDRELGHFRRYTPATATALVEQAGLRVEHVFGFNMLGALGWLLNARILRRSNISGLQLNLFDRLVPVLRMEDAVRVPFGLSLITVARRP